MRPRDAIEAVTARHRQIAAAVASLHDDGMRHPSLLPGWSRARVIAHLAHKSRSHVLVFEAARAGSLGNQYPDGQASGTVEGVSSERIWTAAELEALTPDERDAIVRAGLVTDPARVSPKLLARAQRKADARVAATEGSDAAR